MRRLLALSFVVGTASPASAQGGPWAEVLGAPGSEPSRRLLVEGLERLECGLDPARCGTLAPPAPALAFAQAALRFERVAGTLSSDPEIALLLAYALRGALGDRPAAAELARCVEAFEAVRARDCEHAAARVSFELAILHTRAGDPESAAREYEALDRLGTLGGTPPVHSLRGWEQLLLDLHAPIPPASYLGNWAEVSLLAGDAVGAASRYRRALDAVLPGTVSAALATWGLALAEERSGNHSAALAGACRAIELGLPDEHAALAPRRAATRDRWGPFAALHDDDVLFEPAHEVRAYEALGHECLAARSATPEGRRYLLERARASWRFFLLEGGNGGRWAERARAAEDRLSALLEVH